MSPTNWNEIKHLVQKLNPEFYEAIETVRPNPNLKIHIVEYGYGDTITDAAHFYVPDGKGKTLTFPKPLPLMFLLEGLIEIFFETERGTIPWSIFTQGKAFPIVQFAENLIEKRFSPNENFHLRAGIRNAYMLQLHGFNEYYSNLQKYYKIPIDFKPSKMLDHYKIFREIAKKEHSSWKVKILIFDNKWLEHIWNDPQWFNVRYYFYKNTIKLTSSWNWSLTFNQAIRDITRAYNFKIKGYSEDIIKQILLTTMGTLSAYIPTHNQIGLPFDLLAQAFNAHYGTHNLPIIMQTHSSDLIGETKYLSISQNTATIYDIKSFRPLLYLHEIKKHLPLYLEHLQTHPMTSITIYGKMHGHLAMNYYSEKGVPAENILRAADLESDSRVKLYEAYRTKPDQTFPERSPFLKAFVSFTYN